MRRPVLLASVVLLLSGLVIGAVWAVTAPSRRSADVARELAALQRAEAARRPAAGGEGSGSAGGSAAGARRVPALCGNLRSETRGEVSDPALGELSGLVRSRSRADLFWANEDSGADAELSALRGDGTVVGTWEVPGAEHVDWEDIATGPGPDGGAPVLYAADIGDNDTARETISVYRVPEPMSPSGGGHTAPAQRLTLRYPDGAHDAETLLVDPLRGTLVVVTKALTGGAVYAASPPLPFGGTATLREIAPAGVPLGTGGDISADGSVIAVRGYFSLSVWPRRGREPITQAMKRKPCVSPTALTDGQGEAIALSGNGTTAWTVAEGVNAPLLRLRPR